MRWRVGSHSNNLHENVQTRTTQTHLCAADVFRGEMRSEEGRTEEANKPLHPNGGLALQMFQFSITIGCE